MKKAGRVAALSFLTSLIRVIGGPVTILLVSSILTVEEMGFYYTFFSFISMAQLFEIGVGFVLKQYYSHDCKHDEDGKLTADSREICGRLFKFSTQWYAGLSTIYILALIPFGYVYFNDYAGDVDWTFPYILLIISTGARVLINVFDSYLDGMQHQVLLNKARLYSSLSMSFSLWVCIYSNFKLVSLGLSQLVYVFVFVAMLFLNRREFWHELKLKVDEYSFKKEMVRIFPLLGKTSIVWFFGYFFWNGFTLLSFKIYGAEMAGKIGLSVALARGGYDVANSFVNNQRTIVANAIANDKFHDGYGLFKKYFLFSLAILACGFTGFMLLQLIWPDFYLFDKVIPNADLIALFVFYFLILYMTGVNNFVRSYKIEPFLLLSVYNAIAIPVAFYITPILGMSNLFTLSLVAFAPSIIISTYVYNKRVRLSKGIS